MAVSRASYPCPLYTLMCEVVYLTSPLIITILTPSEKWTLSLAAYEDSCGKLWEISVQTQMIEQTKYKLIFKKIQ